MINCALHQNSLKLLCFWQRWYAWECIHHHLKHHTVSFFSSPSCSSPPVYLSPGTHHRLALLRTPCNSSRLPYLHSSSSHSFSISPAIFTLTFFFPTLSHSHRGGALRRSFADISRRDSRCHCVCIIVYFGSLTPTPPLLFLVAALLTLDLNSDWPVWA